MPGHLLNTTARYAAGSSYPPRANRQGFNTVSVRSGTARRPLARFAYMFAQCDRALRSNWTSAPVGVCSGRHFAGDLPAGHLLTRARSTRE